MRWLLFDLLAPLASFGGSAPGSIRDTDLLPSRGALLGLIAAALGIRRDERDALDSLSQALRFAVRVHVPPVVRHPPQLLRDFHTAQAPREAKIKGRPRMTRRDELAMPRHELATILSERYYYSDFAATVAVSADESRWTLEALADALREPRFTLYLGRKSCPLHWPLDPWIADNEAWTEALDRHDQRSAKRATEWSALRLGRGRPPFLAGPPDLSLARRYAWDLELPAQLAGARRVTRRDDPRDRQLWLFADREHWRAEAGGPP